MASNAKKSAGKKPRQGPQVRSGQARRGSGRGEVEVVFAAPGTRLHEALTASHGRMKAHILPKDHPMAKQAFRKQTKKGRTKKGERK